MKSVKKISAVVVLAIVSLSPTLSGAAQTRTNVHHAATAHLASAQKIKRAPHVKAHVATDVVIHVPKVYQTSGPGVRYPDKTDPTRTLPRADQLTLACIRRYESHNHLVDGNAAGSEGWYQFTISTWDGIISLDPSLHLPPTPNQASGNQQSAAAVFEFRRNGRFGVQWYADADKCPGTFFFN